MSSETFIKKKYKERLYFVAEYYNFDAKYFENISEKKKN